MLCKEVHEVFLAGLLQDCEIASVNDLQPERACFSDQEPAGSPNNASPMVDAPCQHSTCLDCQSAHGATRMCCHPLRTPMLSWTEYSAGCTWLAGLWTPVTQGLQDAVGCSMQT